MGEAEIDHSHERIIITSHIITNGNAADEKVTALIREEIQPPWPLTLDHIHVFKNR